VELPEEAEPSVAQEERPVAVLLASAAAAPLVSSAEPAAPVVPSEERYSLNRQSTLAPTSRSLRGLRPLAQEPPATVEEQQEQVMRHLRHPRHLHHRRPTEPQGPRFPHHHRQVQKTPSCTGSPI